MFVGSFFFRILSRCLVIDQDTTVRMGIRVDFFLKGGKKKEGSHPLPVINHSRKRDFNDPVKTFFEWYSRRFRYSEYKYINNKNAASRFSSHNS